MNQMELKVEKSLKKIINWDEYNSSLLLEVKREENIFTSSAVAISERVILTAAHSVYNIDSGKIFLDSEYNALSKNFIKVVDVFIHPEYDQNNSNYLNDIALLVLDAPLPASIHIPRIYKGKITSNLSRIGFGLRGNANRRTFVKTNYIALPCDRRFFRCEDYLSVAGDSGGPVYIKERGELKLLGLHSTLEGVNITYSVRVAAYMDWIDRLLPYINKLGQGEDLLL